MKSKINRALLCLIVTLPIVVWINSIPEATGTYIPILYGSVVFIGLWAVLKPRKSGKDGK